MRPFPPEASAALLPPPLLRLLPGGAIQFPGGPFVPLWTSAFHGALLWPDYNTYMSVTMITASAAGQSIGLGFFGTL